MTFKRKSAGNVSANIEKNTGKNETNVKKEESTETKSTANKSFSNDDKKMISLYYADSANAKVLQDIITHTQITKEQDKKLKTNKTIPADIQVMPLPLELERLLSPLPSSVLRVHVAKHVILMNVKSRHIIDMINL